MITGLQIDKKYPYVSYRKIAAMFAVKDTVLPRRDAVGGIL